MTLRHIEPQQTRQGHRMQGGLARLGGQASHNAKIIAPRLRCKHGMLRHS